MFDKIAAGACSFWGGGDLTLKNLFWHELGHALGAIDGVSGCSVVGYDMCEAQANNFAKCISPDFSQPEAYFTGIGQFFPSAGLPAGVVGCN